MNKLFLFLSLLFFLLSCDGNHKKLTSYLQPTREQKFKTRELDFIQNISFLFIIDASGSMDEHQKTLSKNIQLFLEPLFLNYPYYNYTFSVTTTSPLDFINTTNQGQSIFVDKSYECGGILSSQFSYDTNIGSYLYYSSKDLRNNKSEDLVCLLSHNITSIKGASGREPFFDTLSHIIKQSDEGFKDHFFGEDKFLILFFLSDAWGDDDKNYITDLMDGNNAFTASKKFSDEQIKQIQSVMGTGDNIRSYAVVHDDKRKDKCSSVEGSGEPFMKTIPRKFTDIVRQKIAEIYNYPYHLYRFLQDTEGLKVSICDKEWGKQLVNVFDNLKHIFPSMILYLDAIPKTETIEVFFNNKKVPEDFKKGWSYNPESLSIRLNANIDYLSYKEEFNRDQNDEIIIRYNPINIELLNKKN